MYVIQGTPSTAIGTIGQSETGTTFAADRCVWRTEPDSNGGYTVVEAEWVPVSGTTYVSISNPVFGYIGKSGRFVAITN